MFAIVEIVIDKAQSDLPDKDLPQIVHGNYTLLEALEEVQEMYKSGKGKWVYIQEVTKDFMNTKEYKVIYVKVNNIQSLPVYLLK